MKLTKFSLGATAIMYLVIGVVSLVAPVWVANGVQIELPTATAITDFRATYGGFCSAVGVFLFICLRNPAWHRIGLLFQAISFVGFGGARLFGLLSESEAQPTNWILICFEVTGLALALWCLRRERRAA